MNHSSSNPRSNLKYLLLIAALAIVLRLAAAVYLGDVLVGVQQTRVEDQVSYNLLAQAIIAGRGYSFQTDWYPFTPANTPTAHWSFLYPLYLAGIYLLFGVHPLAARIVQVIISGILSTLLFYQLGKQFFNEKIGILSALLGAVYIYFVYYDATLMTETLYILAVLTTVLISLKISTVAVPAPAENQKAANKVHYWILLGVFLGLAALLRQSILLWIPALFVWLLWFNKARPAIWKGIFITSAITVAFILPWTVRNYVVYKAFLPLNSNAAYALYSSNHPNQGIHFDQDYVAPLPPDLLSQNLNEAQWSSALTQRGVGFILADPKRYFLLTLSRVPIFFNFWFTSESTFVSNMMRVLSFGLYLPFFLYGLVLSFRNWRRYSLIYLFALVYCGMHVLTWASVRYRLPVDATLMPFAALAVVDIAQKLRSAFTRHSRVLST